MEVDDLLVLLLNQSIHRFSRDVMGWWNVWHTWHTFFEVGQKVPYVVEHLGVQFQN